MIKRFRPPVITKPISHFAIAIEKADQTLRVQLEAARNE